MIPSRWSSAIAILRRRQVDPAEESLLRRRAPEVVETTVDAQPPGNEAERASTSTTLEHAGIELGRIHARIRALLKQLTR